MPHLTPQTLLDALKLFIQEGETVVRGQSIANLKTALRKYIIPNLSKYNFSSSDLEGHGFEHCLSKISLETFLKAAPLEILSRACQSAHEAGELNPIVERTTYRPALNKFLKWLERESWYNEAAGINKGKYSPKTRYGTNIEKANRGRRDLKANPYGLRNTELPLRGCLKSRLVR
ncbi:hypothetical protein [Leptolyngbya sp. FACHB-16]|uniref:hypothetical protein n=1 Tax=unclassified Leptolyngbya TaxID=2650499 RepID=UPI0016876922|nr:hypothetical protein [Leptolyngbya sp. FACHB-16]MBD2152967.1 hypothetical protein [Leptolyngbya sp. FACHB-16]